MKKIYSLLITLCISSALLAQSQFEILVERPGEKTFKGILSRAALEKDSSFTWYAENFKAFISLPKAIETLKHSTDSIKLVAFMGTWCDDSHFIIPRLYAFADAANFSDSCITLIGVDRKKKTLGGLSEALQISKVPTIIVYKNGKELGRVIEYGKYGQFDKELAEIISSAL